MDNKYFKIRLNFEMLPVIWLLDYEAVLIGKAEQKKRRTDHDRMLQLSRVLLT